MKNFNKIMIKVTIIAAVVCVIALSAEYILAYRQDDSTGSYRINNNWYSIAIHDNNGNIVDYLWESVAYVDDSCLKEYWVFAPEGVDMWNMTDYGYTAVRWVGIDYPEYGQYIVHE